jgi:hypothetical protein
MKEKQRSVVKEFGKQIGGLQIRKDGFIDDPFVFL